MAHKTANLHRNPDRPPRAKSPRIMPFSTKLKPDTFKQMSALADEMTEEEGRVVPLAEVIERAVNTLIQKRAS